MPHVQAEPALTDRFQKTNLNSTPSTKPTLKNEPAPSEPKSRMRGDCTICSEMFPSGAKIYMPPTTIPKAQPKIRWGLQREMENELCAVETGNQVPICAASPSVQDKKRAIPMRALPPTTADSVVYAV